MYLQYFQVNPFELGSPPKKPIQNKFTSLSQQTYKNYGKFKLNANPSVAKAIKKSINQNTKKLQSQYYDRDSYNPEREHYKTVNNISTSLQLKNKSFAAIHRSLIIDTMFVKQNSQIDKAIKLNRTKSQPFEGFKVSSNQKKPKFQAVETCRNRKKLFLTCRKTVPVGKDPGKKRLNNRKKTQKCQSKKPKYHLSLKNIKKGSAKQLNTNTSKFPLDSKSLLKRTTQLLEHYKESLQQELALNQQLKKQNKILKSNLKR